jgi:predicted ABC-type ATPase
MFAGPNGSGKSTLINVLPRNLLGVYINPDDIEKTLRETGRLDLSNFGITAGAASSLIPFLSASSFLKSRGISLITQCARMSKETRLLLAPECANSYLASVIADFLRNQLVHAGKSFSFETVMSSPDKIDLLRNARQLGYRTYLYYVATEDPIINISRVRNRVRLGGHPVPEDKIIGRYDRSLGLLAKCIRYTNRAYLFDNSGDNKARVWIAQITDAGKPEFKTDRIPAWLSRSLDLNPGDTDVIFD